MYDAAFLSALEKAAGKPLKNSVPLSSMTTIGCGGPAALVAEVDTPHALSEVLAAATEQEMPWFVIGLGSNLLVADDGWDGMILMLTGDLKACRRQGDGLACGGGASLPAAARTAMQEGLSGLEALAGIPGTLGGAVSMNAGAYGSFIGEITESVQVCLPGKVLELAAESLRFGYRHCELPDGSVVSKVVLSLESAGSVEIGQKMESFRYRREAAQPQGVRTFGSAFRNPVEGEGAGRLLEQAGCKGLARGGAAVSGQHANFIINRGGATTGDVLSLMNSCRKKVFEQFGVKLEPEVRFLGNIGLEPL